MLFHYRLFLLASLFYISFRYIREESSAKLIYPAVNEKWLLSEIKCVVLYINTNLTCLCEAERGAEPQANCKHINKTKEPLPDCWLCSLSGASENSS